MVEISACVIVFVPSNTQYFSDISLKYRDISNLDLAMRGKLAKTSNFFDPGHNLKVKSPSSLATLFLGLGSLLAISTKLYFLLMKRKI